MKITQHLPYLVKVYKSQGLLLQLDTGVGLLLQLDTGYEIQHLPRCRGNGVYIYIHLSFKMATAPKHLV